MIQLLPENDREALQETALNGKSQAQYAKESSLSLSGAKSRVQRARLKLMNEIQECCKLEFDKRIKESKEKAMKDNEEKAEKSGNVLTQTMNKDGNLVNIKNLNSDERSLLQKNEAVSADDVKNILFNSDNVVMEKDSDHGLSELSVNKNLKFSLGNSISAIPEETVTESQEINKEPVTESP